MKVSALIPHLIQLWEQHGDVDVMLDVDTHGLRHIEDVDVPVETDAIVIWSVGSEED